MDAAVIPAATPVRKRPTWSMDKFIAPPISMYLRHTYTVYSFKINNLGI